MLEEKIIIFAETSISQKEIKKYLPNASVEPSIQTGDLLKAVKNNFQCAIIIDGNFDFTRAVWHKEILWAIKEGMIVIGSSSMGALRAAELDQFGMIGSGVVYETYKNNITDDDSEVAINYFKYKNEILTSIPLINLRFTLENLATAKKITEIEKENLLLKFKNIFYKERIWSMIKHHLTEEEFLLIKNNYCDIKYLDAKNTLENAHQLIKKSQEKLANYTYKLPNTIYFKRLLREVFNSHEFEKIKENLIISESIKTKLISDKSRITELSKLTGFDLSLSEKAISYLNENKAQLTDTGFMESLKIFRLSEGLKGGEAFKNWCQNKKLDFSMIENTFKDYLMIKRLFQ